MIFVTWLAYLADVAVLVAYGLTKWHGMRWMNWANALGPLPSP